ncbi:MAG: hypothetical protein FWF63_00720 [Fibromonadales bacterium]|nr:hypothetical protein [Fibromonadales bacterium]
MAEDIYRLAAARAFAKIHGLPEESISGESQIEKMAKQAAATAMRGYKPSLSTYFRPNEISSYSPALKKTGGYSYAPQGTVENEPDKISEEERKEKCELQKLAYDESVNLFFNNKMTLEQLNKQIKMMNTYFVSKGCPELPPFEPPPPRFTMKR